MQKWEIMQSTQGLTRLVAEQRAAGARANGARLLEGEWEKNWEEERDRRRELFLHDGLFGAKLWRHPSSSSGAGLSYRAAKQDSRGRNVLNLKLP